MNLSDLPSTVYDMVLVAIDDARGLDRRIYQPHSGDWHCPQDHGQCLICLAGSVLATRYDRTHREELQPWHLPYHHQRKLEALDEARIGRWIDAFRHMHLRLPPRATFQRLVHLPTPRCSGFSGWEQFEALLHSLESIVPSLREIEREFLHG